MSLKQQITEDMKCAMKARQTDKLSTIRMLLAAMKQVEVDERVVLDDNRIIAIITKMVKQRQDSVRIYREAGRNDMADKEAAEITVLQAYLPQQLSDAEIAAAVDDAITQTGASGMSDMGKVMGVLKGELAGRADMAIVSRVLKEKLGK
ncbi:MAG: GatB/YqeY domain-containing protein [Neisseriaceae bacterium]|nr:GatB/YqeY domain-containing protein [Neisseriaceae bacterium]MBQ9724848.1 GatB/YqeY domain-containing protein [Neisseriaceae bacterium]